MNRIYDLCLPRRRRSSIDVSVFTNREQTVAEGGEFLLLQQSDMVVSLPNYMIALVVAAISAKLQSCEALVE